MMEAPIAGFEAKHLAVESLKNQTSTTGKRIQTEENQTRGRCVGASRQNSSGKPHILQSVTSQAVSGEGLEKGITPENIRWQVFSRRAGTSIVCLVDSSGSMLAKKKIEAAKGCVLSLLEDAYVCRDTVSMIAYGGKEADIVLPPTSSPELAYEKLRSIRTGGKTPLHDALAKGLKIMAQTPNMPTLFVLVSDGLYTAKGIAQPEEEIRRFGEEVFRHNAKILLVDAEKKSIFSLGAAKKLADLMGAVYMPIDELRADAVRSAVDSILKI